jgi:hypothetical protein
MFKYKLPTQHLYSRTLRRFFSQKPGLIQIKELNLSNLDVRKSFNINKDVLVYKGKSIPEDSFTIYKTNTKHFIFYGILTMVVTSLAGYFFYNIWVNKKKQRYTNILTFLYIMSLASLYTFMLKHTRRIDVHSLRNNKLKIHFPLRSVETDFDAIRIHSEKLYIKDKPYYINLKKGMLYPNEDLAMAIMKGYKVKII